jgi:hypothetical protein
LVPSTTSSLRTRFGVLEGVATATVSGLVPSFAPLSIQRDSSSIASAGSASASFGIRRISSLLVTS